MGFKIGDLYWALRAKGGAQLDADLQKEGAKGGETFGQSLLANIKKSWSGAEIGRGLVQGLGLAGGLGAAKLLGDGIGAVKDAIVGTVSSAIDFQRAMQNVNSITKATDKQLADMSDQVLTLSGDFGQSATTMAEGLYDISSSGFQGADAMKVLESATKAATAGLATTAQSASGITAVLNAYGKSADDAAGVSDILFQTVNRGVITFPELSDQIGKTTALAAPLGVSLEEVAAATALMTRNGVGAEETFTQINAVMNSMLMPSKQAADLAAELGLDWSAAALKANGLAKQMALLVEKTGGSEEKMAQLLGDTRAVRGAFVLAKNAGKDLNAELAIMQDSAGATASAFEEQSKSTAFHLAQMQAKIEAAQIEIGTKLLPVIASLADVAVEDVVPALEGIANGLQTVADFGDILSGKFEHTTEKETDFGKRLIDLAGMVPFVGSAFGVLGDQIDKVGAATDSTAADVESARGSMSDDLATMESDAKTAADGTSGSMGRVGTAAGGMASKVGTATEGVKTDVKSMRDTMLETEHTLASAFFGPLEAKASAYEAHQATLAASEARRQAKTRSDVKDTSIAVTRSLARQEGALEELGKQGNLTLDDVTTFKKDATAAYKAMGQTIPPKLQAIINKLEGIARYDGRDVTMKVYADFIKRTTDHRVGGYAEGGRPPVGVPVLVGEHRAELFVPDTAGRIYPDVKSGLEALGTVNSKEPKPGDVTNITVALPTTARPDAFETARQLRRLADLKLLTPTEKYG